MASLSDITVKKELRLCHVLGKVGYFHCWEHYSNVVPESLLRGGYPGGTISFVRALVEFPEGMGYADPKDLKFCDETHADLCAMDKFEKENKDAKA